MPSYFIHSYKRPLFYISSHLETILPSLLRKINNPPAIEPQRISTPDGDFLDLFWSKQGANKLVILQHGLEGSADRPYIQGMSKCFFDAGFDTLAWNYRGCGEELNNTEKFYHSGATYDLDLVVNTAKTHYDELYLVGFSLGGNLTLKYVGESPRDPKIKKVVAISAPLDLEAGVTAMHSPRGIIYEKRFVKNLKSKVVRKNEKMPESMNMENLKKVKTLRDFDDYYTAPLHGYTDATDYYAKCSSKFFLHTIQIPTLILNALNDPILSKESLNESLAKDLQNVTFEITKHGGHVGYTELKNKYYWSERRAVDFCVSTDNIKFP